MAKKKENLKTETESLHIEVQKKRQKKKLR